MEISQLTLSLVVLGVLYLICLSIYRVFLCPIARFPGPKLAALSFWYEFYYDVICDGQYEFKIAKMHEQYGPIVRVNPYELHINDPGYHDTLYSGVVGGSTGSKNRQIHKWDWQARQFGTPNASFGTVDHHLHRIRRAAVAPLFSKRLVNRLEPFVQSYVDRLIQRLAALQGSGTIVNMVDALAALTADIITDYTFGRSYGFLEKPEFASTWHKLIVEISGLGHTCKQFGWFLPLMRSLPDRISEAMNPRIAEMSTIARLIRRQIVEVDVQRKSGSVDGLHRSGPAHRTAFHEILESNELPEAEKNVTRLEQEAEVILIAGTATTSDTLSHSVFQLLNNPSIMERMQEELLAAIRALEQPRSLKLQELERLPYLTAVIKESLRLAHGVVQRTARIHPKSAMVFNEWSIPSGTPVSMSAWMTHLNPSIFPEPNTFRPERWLSTDAKSDSHRLEKYLVTFGKGPRQCLGMNLAYAEMYLTLAALFATPSMAQITSGPSLQLSLFETDESDVTFARDCFIPAPKADSKGVRVLVH